MNDTKATVMQAVSDSYDRFYGHYAGSTVDGQHLAEVLAAGARDVQRQMDRVEDASDADEADERLNDLRLSILAVAGLATVMLGGSARVERADEADALFSGAIN